MGERWEPKDVEEYLVLIQTTPPQVFLRKSLQVESILRPSAEAATRSPRPRKHHDSESRCRDAAGAEGKVQSHFYLLGRRIPSDHQ